MTESLKTLKEDLDYNLETGIFTWKNPPKCKIKLLKKNAGCLNNEGYIHITYKNKKYLAHRLAWYFVHGSFPKLCLDHINGNKTDNRICNLREVTKRQNQQNQAMHRNGSMPGTYYYKNRQKWASHVRIDKKKIHLGLYLTQQEAHEAYVNYIKENNL